MHILIDIGEENVSQDRLQAGAKPALLQSRGGTILHEAIYANKEAIVHKVLSAGVDRLMFDTFVRIIIDWTLVDICMLEIVRQY